MKENRIMTLLSLSAVSLLVLVASGVMADSSESRPNPATGEEINWQVISSGGTDGTSENYRVQGTAGLTAVGSGNSETYGINHGFWQVWYITGDADGSGEIDIDDVVYLIAYIFSGGPPPEPLLAGDADCSGDVDIDDVVYLIAYIFSGGPAPGDPDGDGIPDC